VNLIVGGTGFIGGHLCEYFFAEGEISKGIFRKGSHLRIMDHCGVQCLEADLMDRHTLHEPLDMVDVVYNLASPPPGSPHEEFVKFNNVALRNLLEEANEHGAKVFVHLSPLDVYGFGQKTITETSEVAPATQYQQAKLESEKIVREFAQKNPEMRVGIVRAARGVGSRDTTIVLPILKMMQEGKATLPSGSSSKMSFTHPKDIAQALFRAASSNEKDKTYLVRSFDASLEEVARALIGACGKEAVVKQQGLFSGKTVFSHYAVELLKAAPVLAEQKSWKGFGYVPAYDLGKAAAEIAAWSRKEPWLTENQA
jgi:dihydroflavonol-4-reductase